MQHRCILFYSISLFVVTVCAQATSNASCLTSTAWMLNASKQTPCLVAAFLQSACDPSGKVNIPPLAPNSEYAGPTTLQSNSCQCSSVVYSLVSACAACQGQTYETWNEWSAHCTVVYSQTFSDPIPDGTSVPAWAYSAPENSFNLESAQNISSQGLSDHFPPGSNAQVTSLASAKPSSSTVATTSSSHLSPSMEKVTLGIMSAVLGIAVIVSAVLIAFKLPKFIRMHRERKRGDSPVMRDHEHDGMPSESPFSSRDIGDDGSWISRHTHDESSWISRHTRDESSWIPRHNPKPSGNTMAPLILPQRVLIPTIDDHRRTLRHIQMNSTSSASFDHPYSGRESPRQRSPSIEAWRAGLISDDDIVSRSMRENSDETLLPPQRRVKPRLPMIETWQTHAAMPTSDDDAVDSRPAREDHDAADVTTPLFPSQRSDGVARQPSPSAEAWQTQSRLSLPSMLYVRARQSDTGDARY